MKRSGSFVGRLMDRMMHDPCNILPGRSGLVTTVSVKNREKTPTHIGLTSSMIAFSLNGVQGRALSNELRLPNA